MPIFYRFYKKEKILSRTLEIDEDLYEKLSYLSNNIYDASINQLVNACIERLLQTKEVKLYEPKRGFYVARSFMIRESFWEQLYELKTKYRISMCLLVNIAIKNAIDEFENNA